MKVKMVTISLLTALVIFAQGLYFNEQWLVLLLGLTVVMTGHLMSVGSLKWQWHPLSILLLSNFVLDLFGYLWYLEKGMLIFACLKDLTYLLFYMVLIQESEGVLSAIKKSLVLWMTLVSGITVIAYTSGMFESLHYVIDGRASGSVQYANTFGILLVASIVLLLTMDMENKWRYPGISLSTLALILTMSRAVYLIAIVIFIICLVMKRPSIGTYVSFGLSIIIGLLLIRFFDDSSTAIRLAEGAGASEWHSRLLYYKDAVRMILDRPLGYGYNGYHYAQSFYQTGSTYHVKFVHSGLLQGFLDRGIPGGILLGLFMIRSVFFRKSGLALPVISLAVLGHSVVDMNLQFPVVWLLLILLWTDQVKSQIHTVKIKEHALIPAAIIMITGIFILAAALSYGQGNYRTATDQYPYFTEAYRQLLKAEDDPDLEPYARHLIDLNPYVTEGYRALAKKAEEDGDYEKAIHWYEALVHYSPLLIENHEAYSHGLILAATYYKAYGEESKAMAAIEKILVIPHDLAELAKERHTDYNVKHKPTLRMTAALMKDYEEAAHLRRLIDDDQ